MKSPNWLAPVAAMAGLLVQSLVAAGPTESNRELPEPLKPWANWVLWEARDLDSPTSYHDPKQALRVWPTRLAMVVDGSGGQFSFGVTVYSGTWVTLPGGNDQWPGEVTVNGTAVPVVEHDGHPAVKLVAGRYELVGRFQWQGIPQRITMPAQIGILALTVDGQPVESPVWDSKGILWLKRDASTEEADKDFLSLKMYSLIEDGIPLWLHTEVELIVAGKSREEALGAIVPAGWKLASLECPIPVAVNEAGQLKAQVRAGKWTLRLSAYRLDHPPSIGFPAGAKAAATEQLIAFRAQPDFRLVEISGLPSIDVSQTSFPNKWREHPVYRWNTASPFRIEERMRGMGLQKPEGLKIERELWLDQNGGGLTFRDHITGHMQQVWRLDAAAGQDLGSVRANDLGQLITRNPGNQALGVEIRDRELNLDATGRMAFGRELSASGWRTDADGVTVKLNLPPGWRLLALFGADWVTGDWLTAWSLLDLFLLLLFTLAVFRMWGFAAALLAFVAFGLSYHEPGAPRYVWLVLLIPLALLRVVPSGWGRRLLVASQCAAVLSLVLLLVPFLGKQIQQCLYPQLEFPYGAYAQTTKHVDFMPSGGGGGGARAPEESGDPFAAESDVYSRRSSGKFLFSSANNNLQYDTKARIQTGPGVPEWSWRAVHFGLKGPVTAAQTVRPILIPMPVERALAMARVILLLGLAAVLLNARRLRGRVFRKGGTVAAIAGLWVCVAAPQARAQLPDQKLLDTLRARLLEKSDAYPNAADIPRVALTLRDGKLAMEVEIHTATRTAVPLPGRLPAWSPVSVKVDGQPEISLRRDDGFLWIVLPAGVHKVTVEGMLANLTEWQWTYQLRPRHVTIDAPGWQVSGVRPGGVPEAQVFFTRVRTTTRSEASYDRPFLQSAVAVDRRLEFGLVWQVDTTVKRLSPVGTAVALRVPLLPGENVLTSNTVVKEGFLEVRLGAQQEEFTWHSELGVVPQFTLATRPDDVWIERWFLVASPVWNVAISGLSPIFEPSNTSLVPVWKPWPGENVTLHLSRPEAVEGATVTVDQGRHEINLGMRQRTSSLNLSLRCSLGEDFLVDLPPAAEPTALTTNGTSLPIRKTGSKIIIPLKPGQQNISLHWKNDQPLEFHTEVAALHLPVSSSNLTTSIQLPENRWVLWTQGPLRGPAVRFWGILLGSLLAAWILSRLAHSPLRAHEWMLLAIGLTQIPLPLALVVVGWLFFLAWRGQPLFQRLHPWVHNLSQVFLIGLSLVVLIIFIAIVAEGLLGSPEMFIRGNDSSQLMLRWYEAHCAGELPQPRCFSVSIWWYRLLMLLWALWLAAALIRWLRWGWQQFSAGACFRRMPAKPAPSNSPPPLPVVTPVPVAILPSSGLASSPPLPPLPLR